MFALVYMHNEENVVQIHAVAVRVECSALYTSLIFFAYAQLSLPHIEPPLVLSCVIAYLPLLAKVSVLLWKYSEYLGSLQVAKQQ